METTKSKPHRQFADPSNQALVLWVVFFLLNSLINGTLPFMFGRDLKSWSQSATKFILVGFVVYAMLFLVVPLILIKGWETVRQKSFLLPLSLAVIATTFSLVFWGINVITVIVLAFLHWRFDLSDYGVRSRGWRGDIIAILIIGLLGLIPVLMRSAPLSFSPTAGLLAALNRLFANPASTVENLFYFGFLTERLSWKTGRWLTPPLIGLMYGAHEMSNPEYWYEQMNFAIPFLGVTIWAAIYLWRRSVVVIWLGDGLYRFTGKLF